MVSLDADPRALQPGSAVTCVTWTSMSTVGDAIAGMATGRPGESELGGNKAEHSAERSQEAVPEESDGHRRG